MRPSPVLPALPTAFLPAGDPSSGRPDPDRKPNGKTHNDKAAHGTILLVDDSEQDHALISAALGENGLHAGLRWARSHEEAVAYLTGRPPFDDRLKNPLPSLVLLDIQMPSADGFTVLSWLRSQPAEWRRTPVVMLTTSQRREEIMRAYDMGANSYLVKPTGFDELCRTLKETTDYWLKRNRSA